MFSRRSGSEAPARKALIERILLAEYEAAQAEFDRARNHPDIDVDIRQCGKRYIEATARLRRFLADGEVPHDVLEKLNSQHPD
jgi:hypothetical protein